ncbi:hypothetical protein LCGC14_2964940 [marine sediment metagenome]|uniref:Uncharacterized protein n=1 Tax=marine sediment metagenome TaxID=412755 RepID=A0A0F8XYM9_9ZZZZ
MTHPREMKITTREAPGARNPLPLGAGDRRRKVTYEELLEWGRTEAATRKMEMATVDSAESLKRVQDAVKKRRNLAGLSRADATHAVMTA